MHTAPPPAFHPLPPPRPGLVTWIHLGDLHMVRHGEQNDRDLHSIVDEINQNFAGHGISFVYLPGDIADDGSVRAYEAVRHALDRLDLPWCGIVGDHDVHERSFTNFQRYIDPSLHGAFSIGDVRFLRLNSFSEPRPDSFQVSPGQLAWLESELTAHGQRPSVLLTHCYPSDLREGGPELAALLHRFPVRIVDMGHTHYNEISNDGHTLYTATRSTGQIEEGHVGYTVVSLDGDALSWHFVPLGKSPFVAITSPADERLLPDAAAPLDPAEPLTLRALAWGKHPIHSVDLHLRGRAPLPMALDQDAWTCDLPAGTLPAGTQDLLVRATDIEGHAAKDDIRIHLGPRPDPLPRFPLDQDNALPAWPSRHLLGTQLGPNKNGHQW